MKVWQLIKELEKAPAGAEVVIYNSKTCVDYKVHDTHFDDADIEAFTQPYNFSIYIGSKIE